MDSKIEEVKTPPMMTRTVRLPKPLDDRISEYADELDRSVSWVVRKALDKLLDREEVIYEVVDDPYYFHHPNGEYYRIPQPGEVWWYTDHLKELNQNEVLKWRADILAIAYSKYAKTTYIVIDAAPGPKLIPLFPHQYWEQGK